MTSLHLKRFLPVIPKLCRAPLRQSSSVVLPDNFFLERDGRATWLHIISLCKWQTPKFYPTFISASVLIQKMIWASLWHLSNLSNCTVQRCTPKQQRIPGCEMLHGTQCKCCGLHTPAMLWRFLGFISGWFTASLVCVYVGGNYHS